MIKGVNCQPVTRHFFWRGGGGGGEGATAKGKKGMPYTISLNSSHLLPPHCFNMLWCIKLLGIQPACRKEGHM